MYIEMEATVDSFTTDTMEATVESFTTDTIKSSIL